MFYGVPWMSVIAHARGPVPRLVRRARVHGGGHGDARVFHGVPRMSCIAHARVRRGVPYDVERRITRAFSSENPDLFLVLRAFFASSYEPYDEDHESRDETETR